MSAQKKVSSREIRRVLGAAAPTIQQLAHNDQVTQKRIVALEKKLDDTIDAATDCDSMMAKRLDEHQSRIAACEAFTARTFTQRLRWILRGEQ